MKSGKIGKGGGTRFDGGREDLTKTSEGSLEGQTSENGEKLDKS